ncbi:hypothetical protein ACFXAF_08545 [Kitasatospora sp. NPDC059463]|uniref:hypothetical protein n=1 Tax=unclassified Kitasatospora TaxID=2633591 RepID=UPI003681605A
MTRVLGAGLLAALLPMGTAAADPAAGGTGTVWVSRATDGTQANGGSGNAVISRNGRYVAFTSWATNLVPFDSPLPGNQPRGYLRDLQEGTVERVRIGAVPGVVQDFSAAGDRVVIRSNDNGMYVRDLPTGVTRRVDVDLGDYTGGYTLTARISGSGRYVVFSAGAPSGPGADQGIRVYVRDLLDGTTQWVSRPNTGTEFYDAAGPVVSDDGQRIAYTYIRRGSPSTGHVHLLDRNTGERQIVDVAHDGSTPERTLSGRLSLSADGGLVLFNRTDSSPVTANDQKSTTFIREVATGTTRPTPFTNITSCASLSADGRTVLLMPDSPEGRPPHLVPPIFMWKRETDQVQIVSVWSDGSPVGAIPGPVAMTGDGAAFAFESGMPIVPGKSYGVSDVFVRTLPAGT